MHEIEQLGMIKHEQLGMVKQVKKCTYPHQRITIMQTIPARKYHKFGIQPIKEQEAGCARYTDSPQILQSETKNCNMNPLQP